MGLKCLGRLGVGFRPEAFLRLQLLGLKILGV